MTFRYRILLLSVSALLFGAQLSHGYYLRSASPAQVTTSSTSSVVSSQTPSESVVQIKAASPSYTWMFQFPLPIPQIAQPIFTETVNGRQIQYYQVTIEAFSQQVYPNLGPTHMTGYNGTSPGPTFRIQRGTETVIRYVNNGNQISSVHLHGSYTHSVWDGWASDQVQPGQWKDYYYPNSESARPMWYHDHALGLTSTNVYYGQAGCWIIYDPAEDSLGLPSGQYDVPLAIMDKSYQSSGELVSPNGNLMGFYGDIIEVNGQPWPYLQVEPRKYRLRLFDMSLSRCYSLYFADKYSNFVSFQVIASDSGLFAAPVTTNKIMISSGERYEVVIDFSQYRGQNVTLMNGLLSSIIPQASNTNRVMRFVVGNTVTDGSNNGAVPSVLDGNIPWPAKRTTVDHVFNFQSGGDSQWTINGVDFDDVQNRVLARPPQGTVELWQLNHAGGAVFHPVHIHLVNMQIISRSGGLRGLQPYEAAGLKDVVLLEPGESVKVLAVYGPWNGLYMFHCHDLIHEDNTMLDAFNSTYLAQLGYNTTQDYADPMNTNFSAQPYSDADFEPAAVSSAVFSLAQLDPYGAASSLMAKESSLYQQTASTTKSKIGLPLPTITLPTITLPKVTLPTLKLIASSKGTSSSTVRSTLTQRYATPTSGTSKLQATKVV